MLAWLVWFVPGCVAPPAEPTTEMIGGGVLYPHLPAEAAAGAERDWQPPAGRMNAYVRKRHLPPGPQRRELFVEDFDNVAEQQVPGWRVVGAAMVSPVTLDGAKALELSVPADAVFPCGIEHDLDAALLAGREVRVDLRFTCRSARRVEALEGIEFFLRVVDRAGRPYYLPLPLAADITPGWETQSWYLRCDAQVASAALCMHARRAGAILTMDRISLTDLPPVPILSSGPRLARGSPAPPINIVAGGDFETGSAKFHAAATRRGPNGDESAVPLRWEFDNESAEGGSALLIYVQEESARVAFGPLNLQRLTAGSGEQGFWYHLAFSARADRPTPVTVTLRTPSRVLGRAAFQLADGWRQYTERFFATAQSFEQYHDLSVAELAFDFAGDGGEEADLCRLDAVSLTDKPAEGHYERAAAVEVGLIGPAPDPVDLANLVNEGEPVAFGVRLVTDPHQKQPPASTQPTESGGASKGESPVGHLAMDVLDAGDRVIWTRTSRPAIPPGMVYNELIRLPLPRGYYRVLATLWRSEPGESEMISQDALALAVIAANDPVPLSNRFGLSLAGANVSMRTTHLGAGWVFTELSAGRAKVTSGDYDFSPWQALQSLCGQGRVQLVAAVDPPRARVLWEMFAEQLLGNRAFQPIAVVVQPPAIATRPVEDYQEELLWFRRLLAAQAPETLLIRNWPAGGGPPVNSTESAADLLAVSCPDTPIPEKNERLLQALTDPGGRKRRLVDLHIPVRLGGMIEQAAPGVEQSSGPLQRLAEPLDPLRSASRMVRAMLIRGLVGAELACCEAVALDPVRSIYDDARRRLHEADLSPRPALAAFDLMTALLNDATLVRWLDQPGGGRVLYYEKDDGRAVAAVWRPFGMSPTWLALAGLPAAVKVLDCVGRVEPAVLDAERRIIEVNEIVRYVVAPAEQREVLRKSLESVEPLGELAERAGR